MSERTSGGVGPVHALAAVIGPALLLAIAWLLATREQETALSADAQAVEEELRKADPDLVFLGASTMAEAVNLDRFRQSLGGTDLRMAKLAKGGTMPPVWYVLAKERLFGAGLEPRVIVVGATPRWFLETEVSTQNAKKVIAEHLTTYDPVLAEKAYGQKGQHLALEKVGRARTGARAGFLDLVREWSVGLIWGEGEGTLAERGRRVAEPALATVFGAEGAVDLSLHKRVIPIIEEPEAQGAGGKRPRTVAESFVPALIDLAEQNGARIVFVWLPYPAVSTREEEIDPARLADLVRAINQAGAGWLDLHALAYPPDCFMDRAHMNAKGRERFTPELAKALTDLGAFREGPMIRAVEPFFVGHRARREGQPAPLAALTLGPFKPDSTRLEGSLPDYDAWSNRGGRVAGVGPVSPLVVFEDGEPLKVDHWGNPNPEPGTACHMSSIVVVKPRDPAHALAPAGHFSLGLAEQMPVEASGDVGWWAYPGSSLVFDLDGTPGGATARVAAVLEPLGAGHGGPTVEVEGQALALQRRGETLAGELSLPLPESAWRVSISVPAGGPMVLVRWLVLESDSGRVELAGREALTLPPSANLLAQTKAGEARITGRFQPIPLTGFTRHETLALGVVEAPGFGALSNEALRGPTTFASASPVRLAENGIPLRPPAESCFLMKKEASLAGRCCQEGETLLLSAHDGSVPGQNGRAYTLDVLPKRLAANGIWIVPGDAVEMPTPGWQALPLRHGASRLALQGVVAAGDPTALFTLALEVGGQPTHRWDVPFASLAAGPLELPVEPALPPGGKPLLLRLASPDGAPFLLLSRAELQE